jgi:CelD/BcsL family acetyltransferase involved in cellulose biosynthesis
MNHYTDAMIATRGILSDAQFNQVASQVRNIKGVKQITRSQRIPRVIWVSYHTGKTRALAILKQLAQSGFNASLVGM